MALKSNYKDDVFSGDRVYTISGTGANQTIEETTVFTQEGDVFGANDMNLFAKAVNDSQTSCVISVPNSWSASAPYSQTISLSGYVFNEDAEQKLKAYTDNTLASATVKANLKYAGMITDAVCDTTNNTITLYCGVKKPSAVFSIELFGVRAS